MAHYLTGWADILAQPNHHLTISYTNTGPTLDLHCADTIGPAIRWQLEPHQ